jgi:rhamnulose-1-phosphate aldolase
MPGTIPKPLEPMLRQFAEVTGHISDLGWAEAGAGNISVDVTPLIKVPPGPASRNAMALPRPLPSLAGHRLLVTATGSRFRDFHKAPEDKVCLVEISPDGSQVSWRGLVWSAKGVAPTSELQSHLEIHSTLRDLHSENRAIVHAHTTHLATLSHLRRCADSASLNRLLWSIHSEVKVFAPRGATLLPYIRPGSDELGAATARAVRDGADTILWRYHGSISHGLDPYAALDRLHVLDKAAQMVLLCFSTGEPWEGLDEAQLAEHERVFGS